MVRLLLLSSPALCLLSGVGVSEIIHFFVKQMKYYRDSSDKENPAIQAEVKEDKAKGAKVGDKKLEEKRREEKRSKKYRMSFEIGIVFLIVLSMMLINYLLHSTWVGAEAYASPSIILANKDRFGNKYIIDDFRESYFWMRMNTKEDAKIVSWWDYGYQIAGMSNRAVIVDNNTWNTTHIATVGATFAVEEEESYKICKLLDADYVLVIFGGFSAYSGDDINKFIWMIRIAAGYYPKVKEDNYFSRGSYRIDSGASETMLNCMMFKFSFYRFDEVKPSHKNPEGYDLVRNAVMGRKNIKLRHFSEAYCSESWIVRIFKVNNYPNREIPIKSRFKIRLLNEIAPEFNKIKNFDN